VVTQTPESIKLLGGRLSLHFANTVDWADSGEQLPETDALRVPDALERWASRLGDPAALTFPADLTHVADWPSAPTRPDPDTDSPGLIAVRAFRDALYSLFATISDGHPAPADALSLLHAVHADGVAAASLEPRGDAFALVWPADEPRRVLFAVAADAVALLADPGLLGRVHRCPGRNCGWLFLDTSGRRRWCSMATCGSRAKMRAMYARRRAV
jgi:predicted RNA-binding Zn ribbon-like protein